MRRLLLHACALGAWCLSATAAPAEAQLQQATILVELIDHRQRPLPATPVALTDTIGAVLLARVTDGAGRATFAGVAPGRYEVRAAPAGSAPFQVPVHVTGALPIELTIRVPAAISDHVMVQGTDHVDGTGRDSLLGESIARVPTRLRARSLQDVIATLPGWSTEDNGLLHVRGVDDGFLYVLDGVPVYERIDAVSGLAPDLAGVSAISVVTGYVPPEFGYKAGGVIELRSATPEEWSGTIDLTTGSDRSREVSSAAGGTLGERVSVRAGAAALVSDRFLDPVHPDNLHNTGRQSSAFGQMEWLVGARDRITGTWSAGRSDFDVPNTEEQQEAGQDQRQHLRQAMLNASWQRSWTSWLVTQAAVYHRRSRASLGGSAYDRPLSAEANRELRRSGMLLAATRQAGAHVLKAGAEWQGVALAEAFSFAVTASEEAREAGFREEALAFSPDRPFTFRGRATPMLVSLYAQDAWHASPRLTLSGGVRFDRSELLLVRTQVSPRAGMALQISDGTVLRAAVSRFFQPPQPENLLLASSPESRVLSALVVAEHVGGADIEPERQWASEVAIEQRLPGARFELAVWMRRIRDVADPNVFAGTTIIFPNAVSRGRAQGVEARLELPRTRGWSAYANLALASVTQTGPITGGLFLEDEVEEIEPGEEFAPDHDQPVAASGGVTYEHARSRVAASVTMRVESGTPVQREELDDLLDRPGAHLVDFDSGRVRTRTVVSALVTAPLFSMRGVEATLRVQLVNLLNHQYAFNLGNPFSGTHFGAPRSAAVGARFTFR
jgi:outer membrane receptor for ferrienterochelin and colicin